MKSEFLRKLFTGKGVKFTIQRSLTDGNYYAYFPEQVTIEDIKLVFPLQDKNSGTITINHMTKVSGVSNDVFKPFEIMTEAELVAAAGVVIGSICTDPTSKARYTHSLNATADNLQTKLMKGDTNFTACGGTVVAAGQILRIVVGTLKTGNPVQMIISASYAE